MLDIERMLIERNKYLDGVISSKKACISKTKGKETIYSNSHGNKYQYYKKDGKGIHYIKVEDMELVKKSIQQEYNMKVLRAAEREYKRIEGILKVYKDKAVEDIYDSLPKGKKILVVPVKLSDDEYVAEWKKEEFESLSFREGMPVFYSAKGERMRSKSEVIIADMLNRLRIEYKYERPLRLKRLGIVHPDFTLLDVRNRREIYLEHLGMLDDQTYRNNAIMKIRDYENSGYYVGDRLIVTEETINCPLDIKNVERKVRFILGC